MKKRRMVSVCLALERAAEHEPRPGLRAKTECMARAMIMSIDVPHVRWWAWSSFGQVIEGERSQVWDEGPCMRTEDSRIANQQIVT